MVSGDDLLDFMATSLCKGCTLRKASMDEWNLDIGGCCLVWSLARTSSSLRSNGILPLAFQLSDVVVSYDSRKTMEIFTKALTFIFTVI